jgi:hypothetical protein
MIEKLFQVRKQTFIRIRSSLNSRNYSSDAYAKALSMNLLQSDVEQIVPIVLARAGFEKRQIETGDAGVILLRHHPGYFLRSCFTFR